MVNWRELQLNGKSPRYLQRWAALICLNLSDHYRRTADPPCQFILGQIEHSPPPLAPVAK
jgi:hypothetical protein